MTDGLLVMKTFMNMKTSANYSVRGYHMQFKCIWEVMIGIGINNNLVLSFVTASAVGLKPIAIRDGLR